MATVKLLSTDFDGTLYHPTESPPVPAECVAAIARLQASGGRWVINTGRDFTSLTSILGEVELVVEPDYLVIVEREIYERVDSGYRPWEAWNAACREAHARLFARVEPDLPPLVHWIQNHYQATVYADAYSPFCLVAGSNSDADHILARVERELGRHQDFMIMRNDVYARLNHAAYTKGSALGEIGRRLGVGPAATLAAGDHLNDLPMLSREVAHHLVAPSNAVPEVKAAVRGQGGYVSDKVAGHGLLEGLQYHLGLSRAPVGVGH